MSDSELKIIEEEWSDKFGSHYMVKCQAKSGRIYSMVLTKTSLGWPSQRQTAAESVERAARLDMQVEENK